MYVKGDYWMICDTCGFAYRKSQMKETWDKLWVCPEDWEPKHPQLSIHAKRDDQRVPVSRPDKDSQLGSTTVGTTAAVDARTLILSDASTLSNGDSIGITLDDGIVQWLALSASPSGNTVSLSNPLWAAATAGNNVYLSTVADVNFTGTVSASDL